MAAGESYYVMSLRTDVEGSDEIHIPKNKYTYIGMDEIHFPKAISVGDNAFMGCASILEIDLPMAATIGNGAFMSCSIANPINIPSATTIGNNAFASCAAAESVNMPNVVNIGYNAFQDCAKLTSINIPKAVSIGENAFRGCTEIQSFLAINIQKVGKKAFFGCKKLKEIMLPRASDFGQSVFAECSSLETIEIPNVTKLDEKAFTGCKKIKFLNLQNVPVSQLYEGMFTDLTDIQWLNIQKEITQGSVNGQYRSYLGLRSACNVICRDGIRYKNDDGGTSSKQTTYLTYSTSATEPTILGVKDGKTLPEDFVEGYAISIASDVFKNREELKSLFLPAISKEIGARAFMNCRNLTSVKLPMVYITNAPGYGIRGDAFKDCPNLKYLALGTSTVSSVREKMSSWGLPDGCVIVCSDGTIVVGE